MADRSRFFDDLAGVAGGALSALAGLREELQSLARSAADEAVRALNLVRREEFDAMAELAGNARAEQEQALTRLAALEFRVAALELKAATASGTGGAASRAATTDASVAPGP